MNKYLHSKKLSLLSVSVLLISILSFSSCADDNLSSKIEFKNYAPPIPVKWMGKTVLGYELHGFNFQNSGYDIYRIDILADKINGKLIKSYSDDEFKSIYKPPNAKQVANGGIFFLWPEFTSGQKVPDTLYHKIFFRNINGKEIIINKVKVQVLKKNPVTIDPPVKGKNWWWANGPSNLDMHHRRAVMSFQSHPFNSQRFAVDLVKFSDNKYIVEPDVTLESLTNEDFYSYGEKIYAVADATVFNARDGLPDIQPGITPPLNIDNADGNFVILEIVFNNGNRMDTVYANYAHLKKGSVRVEIGDKVKRGDVIGLLGNSGNTTGPHLHFHIMAKGLGLLFSQGLPFTISSFYLKGVIKNAAELEGTPVKWNVEWNKKQINYEMPALNYLVNF